MSFFGERHPIMEPAASDASPPVDAQQVCAAFRTLGALPGDTVIFHASFKSMGHVSGGPQTVFDGILAASAPGGTVAMPSLWYSGKPEETPGLFHVKSSPTYVGALAEALRLDPRSHRSNHWSHAVAAIGARAQELTRRHQAGQQRPAPWSDTAFASNSPWWRLYKWNALYAFIGVSMRVCTMKHAIEGALVMRHLTGIPAARRAEARATLSMDRVQRLWPYYNSEAMQEELAAEGLLSQAKLGAAKLCAIRSRPLVERTLAKLLAEPEKWLKPPFLEWIAKLEQYR
jgi:aminoglycoside N3'-acetyltransferase